MESSRFLPTPEKQAEIFQYFIISCSAGPFHLASGNVSVNKFSVRPSSQYGYAAKCRVKSTDDENPMTHCDAVGGAGPAPRSLRIQQKRPATGVVSLPAVQPYFTALTFLAKRDFLRAAAFLFTVPFRAALSNKLAATFKVAWASSLDPAAAKASTLRAVLRISAFTGPLAARRSASVLTLRMEDLIFGMFSPPPISFTKI